MEIPILTKLSILLSTDCNKLLIYRKERDGCYNRNTWRVPILEQPAVHRAVHIWTHAIPLYSRDCDVHFAPKRFYLACILYLYAKKTNKTHLYLINLFQLNYPLRFDTRYNFKCILLASRHPQIHEKCCVLRVQKGCVLRVQKWCVLRVHKWCVLRVQK
jgi:hypothetical protein